ncbi:hypothetical protein ACROYT_G007578 [Oculina patagonica]
MSGMELNGVVRNGDVKQQNLTTLEVDKINQSSLTPSEQDDEEEGQVTPLPGSIVDLDVLAWPPDEDGQVHVTVIPSGQDDPRRKSRYSTFHQTPPRLIPRPDNHMCLALTAMLCCCLPLGAVGFICALQVDSAYDDGNREGAVSRAKHAKYWSLTAVVFGMLGIIGASFYLIFFHLVPAIT